MKPKGVNANKIIPVLGVKSKLNRTSRKLCKRAARPTATLSEKVAAAAVKEVKTRVDETVAAADYVLVLKYSVSKEFTASRHMFIRPQTENDKGIAIANVPPFISDLSLKLLLEQYIEEGKVISTFTRRGSDSAFRVVTAIFDSEIWRQQFFQNASNSDPVVLEELNIHLPLTGWKKYAAEYNSQFKTLLELREDVETAVAEYDVAREEKIKAAKEQAHAAPTDDGWVTVTEKHPRAFKAQGRSRGKSTF